MIIWTLAVGALLIFWLYKLNKDYYVLAFFAKRLKTVDGSPVENIAPMPKPLTIFGNTFDFKDIDRSNLPAAVFQFGRKLTAEMKKSYVQYVFGLTMYNVITPEDTELIMNDQSLITKGIVYNFLKPSLREGLLISDANKWHSRRKMLTPAFHFNILAQFEEIFKEESRKFVLNLQSSKMDIVSLSELIPKFTLNSICETALGIKLDECLDGVQYRASFKQIEESFVTRIANPFFMNDTLFKIFGASKYKQHIEIVHDFSSKIIEKRRQLFAEEAVKSLTSLNEEDEFSFGGKKKRYAMLDTLLNAEKDGLINHLGICEEVDTFMFEGYDTTSMGLIFSLMNLSLYPDLQERCYQEIVDNITVDFSELDITQLNKLKYLECFIKETLRMYPSVPIIMRKAIKETTLANKLVLPEGTQITIHIFDILRDPKHFPKPNVFDPERFTPENSVGRHPFAYVPFSAGQRNCIGQKFAMLEMKTLMVYVLKNFKLLPLVDPKEFAFETGIIIRSQSDVKVKLVHRVST